jgi:alpha-galactosidase-like protein
MHFVPVRRDSRRFAAVVSASIALAFVAVFAFAARAQAAENIYWDNYSATIQTVSFSDITGSGGGTLNNSSIIANPEGMTYDSATGRLYVASSSGGAAKTGEIDWINVDGSGSGVLNTSGAEVHSPYGVDIDPATRTIYWANGDGGTEEHGSIGWAKLDGGGGGLLNTTGITVENPYKLAVDPANGKVYWANEGSGGTVIAFANLDNSGGGGVLDTTGAPPVTSVYAVGVDTAAGRVYWLESTIGKEHLSFASVNGGSGGEVSLSGLPLNQPYGLAIDSSIGRIYWANYRNEEVRENAIGFANLAGGGGGISPAIAPVNGPQDPVILKSPTGTGAPAISRDANNPAALTCPSGSWASDGPGSFVYQAPNAFAYQWLLNGSPIAGATASTFTATTTGAYTCTVTAANPTGSSAQTSAALSVKSAKVKLTVKPKTAKAKAGKTATFKVTAKNQGDLKTKNAKVCVKVPNKAKKVLKAKCKSIGKIAARKTKTTKLKIKVGTAAEGSYKVTIQVKGAAGKAVKATVKVVG